MLPAAGEGAREVGGPQPVAQDRVRDEAGMEGDGLLGLGDAVLADEEQDARSRE
jgi:hypothetical protein